MNLGNGKSMPDTGARRAGRQGISVEGSIRVAGGTERYRVMVRDLSATGFRIETNINMTPGTRVFLTIPKLSPFAATIQRRLGIDYGCVFDDPLHDAMLDHIAKLHPPRGYVTA